MRQNATSQEGSALIWALLFVVITSGMIVSHSIFLAAHRRDQSVRYGREALADNFARSGLVEALSWFRRQEAQPVTVFDPQFDEGADPPLLDTIDANIGIVREFPIDGSLWGRYEVRRSEVADVSKLLGMQTGGAVWDLTVRAYVYRRNDPRSRFDKKPNRIELSTAMTTEMRGVQFVLPITAAINLPDLEGFTIGDRALVDGKGVPAIASEDDGTVKVVPVDPDLTGTPVETRDPGFDATPEAIFSMPMSELVSYSDVVIEKKRPGEVLQTSGEIVTITRDHTEDAGIEADRSLVVIDGDLTLMPGSFTAVRGMLYVNGNLQVLGNFKLSGALVVNGTVALTGATDPIVVEYSAEEVDALSDRLSSYRLPRSYKPAN